MANEKSSTPDDESISSTESPPVGASTDTVTYPINSEPTVPTPSRATRVAPPASPAVDPDDDLGSGSTLDDFKLAFKRNTRWLGVVGEILKSLFHYFFIGCTCLLGLLVVLLILQTVAAAVVLLLGVPGYLAFRWFGHPGEYVSPLTVLVTIFWAGYFVTHGWPHLSDGLAAVFSWMKPSLVWMGRVLENISEDDEDDVDDEASKP